MAEEEAKGVPLPSTPPEEQRCRRNDGKSWRCKKPVAEGGDGFCDSHHHQMLARSRVRVSGGTKGGSGSGRRRRGSRTKPFGDAAQAVPVGEKEEPFKAGEEDSEGKEGDSAAGMDSGMVRGRKKRTGKVVVDSGGASKYPKDGPGTGKKSEDQDAQPTILSDGPLHQCSVMKTSGNVKLQRDLFPRRDHAVGDEGEKKRFTKLEKDLKRKDLSKVYGRKNRVKGEKKSVEELETESYSMGDKLHSPVHIRKPEKLELKDDTRQSLYEGHNDEWQTNFTSVHDKNLDVVISENKPKQNVVLEVVANENIVEGQTKHTPAHKKNMDEGDCKNKLKDTVQAPSSSPSSPNIGESSHQASLLFQTKVHGPSTSTTSMADKKQEGGENKTINVMLEDMKTGRARKTQRAKRARRSTDEFSVSRCATVLNEMTDFTAEELVKASRVFVKPFNREMFLSLKDKLRIVWLRDQISD